MWRRRIGVGVTLNGVLSFGLALILWLISEDTSFFVVGSILLFVGLTFYAWGENSIRRKWRTWPTLDEYVKRYPRAATNSGIACYNCLSRKIYQYGFAESDSSRRILAHPVNSTQD